MASQRQQSRNRPTSITIPSAVTTTQPLSVVQCGAIPASKHCLNMNKGIRLILSVFEKRQRLSNNGNDTNRTSVRAERWDLTRAHPSSWLTVPILYTSHGSRIVQWHRRANQKMTHCPHRLTWHHCVLVTCERCLGCARSVAQLITTVLAEVPTIPTQSHWFQLSSSFTDYSVKYIFKIFIFSGLYKILVKRWVWMAYHSVSLNVLFFVARITNGLNAWSLYNGRCKN